MGSDVEEYEVESIMRARLESKKGSKSHWKYFVKWKGYNTADNTWEPKESFDGSEHMIEAFWERISTGDRDYRNAKLFHKGEEFVPIGPPKKRKRTRTSDSLNHESPTRIAEKSNGQNSSRNTLASSSNMMEEPKSKRVRSNSFKHVSAVMNEKDAHDSAIFTSPEPSQVQPSPAVTSPSSLFGSPYDDEKKLEKAPLISRAPAGPSLPSHRARVANPLVKFVEDPLFAPTVDGAISIKARLLGRSAQPATQKEITPKVNNVASSSSSRPPNKVVPKNRSSLLTARKGALTVVKGSFKPFPGTRASEQSAAAGDAFDPNDIELFGPENGMMETDNEDSVKPSELAPSGSELLHIAGVNDDSKELSDFEEDSRVEISTSAVPTSTEAPLSSLEPKEQPKPLDQPISHQMAASWRSTIFGPLTLGVSSPKASSPDRNSTSAFSIALNASISIPVSFKDVYTKNASAPLDAIVVQSARVGPPGTFYAPKHALSLVHTLRGERTGARVTVESNTESDKDSTPENNFSRFYRRLSSGEVFLMMAGAEPLVFYSADNQVAAEWLATPQSLVGLSNTILVSCVSIQDRMGFTEVASLNSKETVTWSSTNTPRVSL